MKKSLFIFSFMFLAVSGVFAQTAVQEAKTKFIYNFTKFFEWPQSERSGDFIIGVLGSGNVYSELKDFTKGKKVIVQDIKVVNFKEAEDVKDCHVLFVSRFKANQLSKLNETIGDNTLIISDSNDGIENGAALNFVLIGNRLSYEFAESNAMQKGLKFSSRIKDMAAKNY